MDITVLINSGILENFCLGIASSEEAAQVEVYAQKNPIIKEEIEKIKIALERQLLKNIIPPSVSVKTAVMQRIYKQQAALKLYPPFIDAENSADELKSWIMHNNIETPQDTGDMFVHELPSTEHVVNFVVVAKKGHEEEMHQDFVEYLFIIKGSCTMNFAGEEKSYNAGDIICIKPNIPHTAVVTSPFPMIALVQRQLCA